MPDNLESLPPSLRNKPEEQQQTYLRLYKAALSRGLTKEEAETSALLSTQAILKKTNVAKQREPVKRPSHVPTKELVEALRKEQGQRLIEEEISRQLVIPPEFGKQLEQGVQRNVIAANFDSKDRLIIIFDTGERLVTRSISVKEIIEQQVGVFLDSNKPDPIPSDGSKYKDFILDGFTKTISLEEHELPFVSNVVVFKNNKIVEIQVEITSSFDVIISSNVDMVGLLARVIA